MSTKKLAKPRKAGEPAYPELRPRLRLLKRRSECLTVGLVTELAEDVKAMLREQKRRRGPTTDDDRPQAS